MVDVPLRDTSKIYYRKIFSIEIKGVMLLLYGKVEEKKKKGKVYIYMGYKSRHLNVVTKIIFPLKCTASCWKNKEEIPQWSCAAIAHCGSSVFGRVRDVTRPLSSSFVV